MTQAPLSSVMAVFTHECQVAPRVIKIEEGGRLKTVVPLTTAAFHSINSKILALADTGRELPLLHLIFLCAVYIVTACNFSLWPGWILAQGRAR
jgi:hypothetical protein